MAYEDWVDIAGSWAAILTLVVAGIGYGRYICGKRRNRVVLERYLKSEKDSAKDKGQRTFTNIMAKTGLGESEIFEASRNSKHVVRHIKTDEKGLWATDLLFEYK